MKNPPFEEMKPAFRIWQRIGLYFCALACQVQGVQRYDNYRVLQAKGWQSCRTNITYVTWAMPWFKKHYGLKK